MLLVHSSCLHAWLAEQGGPPQVSCCTGASARCILTSKPLPASCRSLNTAPCLQLICLHALINKQHPFLKHQQVDTGPPCSQNHATRAHSCHGVFRRTLLPNAVYGKQTVSTHPSLPRNNVSWQWRCTMEVLTKI